jgi:hypothetical protein
VCLSEADSVMHAEESEQEGCVCLSEADSVMHAEESEFQQDMSAYCIALHQFHASSCRHNFVWHGMSHMHETCVVERSDGPCELLGRPASGHNP